VLRDPQGLGEELGVGQVVSFGNPNEITFGELNASRPLSANRSRVCFARDESSRVALGEASVPNARASPILDTRSATANWQPVIVALCALEQSVITWSRIRTPLARQGTMSSCATSMESCSTLSGSSEARLRVSASSSVTL
jgi:hypothetical protein